MKKSIMVTFAVITIGTICLAQTRKPLVTFDQLFPKAKQRQMGLYKLTAKEKEALCSHVESLLLIVAKRKDETKLKKTNRSKKKLKTGNATGGKVYAGIGGGHWIQKNIDSGTFITLEDGSLWKIDPLDKIDAMLWLAISNITVTESTTGSPGYNYLLINTDDGEKAHAKYMGQK